MTLRRRVDQLERTKGSDGDRCPHCPPMMLIDDSAPDPVCEKCGRPVADVVRIVTVIVEADPRGMP